MIGRYQGLPLLLAWLVVLIVLVLISINAESRDYLLGHGKILSMVSLGALLLVFSLTLLGWTFVAH